MQTVSLGPRQEAPLLPCVRIRAIHDAARRVDHPLARMVEVASLIPCNVEHLASAPLELADRAARALSVCGPEGLWCDIAFGRFGWEAVERAAGGWTFGAAIADDDGEALVVNKDAEARAILLVAAVDPQAVAVPWSFRSLQASMVHQMRRAGVPDAVISAQTASAMRKADPAKRSELLAKQTVSADMWAGMLGLWQRPADANGVGRRPFVFQVVVGEGGSDPR